MEIRLKKFISNKVIQKSKRPKVEICSLALIFNNENLFYDKKSKNEEAQKIEINTELLPFFRNLIIIIFWLARVKNCTS